MGAISFVPILFFYFILDFLYECSIIMIDNKKYGIWKLNMLK